MAEWLEAGTQVSGIFRWPGFAPWYADVDWMHSSDFGPLVAFLGNVLWEVATSFGASYNKPTLALARILNMLTAAAKELGVPPPSSPT